MGNPVIVGNVALEGVRRVLFKNVFELQCKVGSGDPMFGHNFTGHFLFPYLKIQPRLFGEMSLKLLFRYLACAKKFDFYANRQKSFTQLYRLMITIRKKGMSLASCSENLILT